MRKEHHLNIKQLEIWLPNALKTKSNYIRQSDKLNPTSSELVKDCINNLIKDFRKMDIELHIMREHYKTLLKQYSDLIKKYK